MIRLILLPLLLFFSFQTLASSDDPVKAMVEKVIMQWMKENQVPGVAVELYVNGKPHAYYFGYANPKKKIPVTKETIFELGSISNVMTSLILAQAVDAAKVQLDNPIVNYMPALSHSFDDITFVDLATHTAGLAFDAPETIKTSPELAHYLSTLSVDDAPGDKWNYSHMSIGILGFALEKAMHQDMSQLYRKQLLMPLHMQPIALTVPDRLRKFYAQGYDKNNQLVKPTELGLFPAANGVKASAADMQHFLSAAIGLPGTPERVFYPMRLTQTAYVELPDRMQGLGWQIHDLDPEDIFDLLHEPTTMNFGPIPVADIYEKPIYDGNLLIDNTGQTKGFRAYIAVIPNKKSGIVILANRCVSDNTISQAGREILFSLSGVKGNEKSF